MTIVLTCNNCDAERHIAASKLSPFFNRVANIPCKSCGSAIIVKVDSNLINKKRPGQPPKRNVHHTQILRDIDRSDRKEQKEIKLLVLSDENTEEQYLILREGENILGRATSDNSHQGKVSIKTSDKQMSRLHCLIKLIDKNGQTSVRLMDRNSTNGTYCNDNLLDSSDEIILSPSDIIRLGNVKCKLI